MQKTWTPPVRWVFGAATLLGVFSALQSYRLNALMLKPMDVEFGRLLVLNWAYWYVPASLIAVIFRLAYRFPLDGPRRLRALAVHAAAAGAFSIVHAVCMQAVRVMLWPGTRPLRSWPVYFQRMYLENLDWALMTYSTIVGLSYALAYYRQSQERALTAAHLETRLVEAQLRTLQAELHPHFLFNTLHAISTLVHSSPDAADRMISRLSDLLRITFDRSGAPTISLHEEIEFLQKYLDIEQMRFQDRLAVAYDIDPETLDADVPTLILQPLVENAIEHGVSPRSGAGTIRITSRHTDGVLLLEVRDNGGGLATSARPAGGGGGVGLSNTRERLGCMYGDQQALELSDSGEGLAVRLRIPFRRASSGSDETSTRVA
jgi:two-component system LytT family sensor kinase